MKQFIFASIILIIWNHPLSAESYNSPLGFSINLPSHWLIVNMQKLKDNPDKYYNINNENLSGIDKHILENERRKVLTGKAEIYEIMKVADKKYKETIYVSIDKDDLPPKEFEKEICEKLPGDLSKAFSRSIHVYECKFRRVSNLLALYSDFDGAISETRSIQYQIQKTAGIIITLTLTCRNENYKNLRKEFENIVYSIR